MITSGKSFSNCKVIALDPILKPVLNVKNIGLHFLTYFADTSFYLLVIKSIYHQYLYQLTIEKMKLYSNLLSDSTHSSWIKFE